MEPSDREIVAAVLAGDRERFRLLVERHGRALLAWVSSMEPRADEARDVFQEAWVRAFAELASLRDPARFRAWLFTIARHALGHRRRRPRELPLEPEGPERPPEPVDPAPGPGAVLERRELVGRIRAEVGALPPRQREVFRLRVAGGLDHAAIGEVLGITPENARANLHQALRKLRERLAGREGSGRTMP